MDERARRTIFQRRLKGLEKKLKELTTLCDVEASMIIYGPKQQDGLPVRPGTWPSDPRVINRSIENYRKQSNEDRRRRTSGLFDVLEEKKKKLEHTLAKLKKNEESKYPTWDERLNDFSVEELKEFHDGLSRKSEDVKKNIEFIMVNDKKMAASSGQRFSSLMEALSSKSPIISNHHAGVPRLLLKNPNPVMVMMNNDTYGESSSNAPRYVPLNMPNPFLDVPVSNAHAHRIEESSSPTRDLLSLIDKRN